MHFILLLSSPGLTLIELSYRRSSYFMYQSLHFPLALIQHWTLVIVQLKSAATFLKWLSDHQVMHTIEWNPPVFLRSTPAWHRLDFFYFKREVYLQGGVNTLLSPKPGCNNIGRIGGASRSNELISRVAEITEVTRLLERMKFGPRCSKALKMKKILWLSRGYQVACISGKAPNQRQTREIFPIYKKKKGETKNCCNC